MLPEIASPAADEYAPFYAGYVDRVRDRDVAALLPRQAARLREALGSLDEERARFRYAPGKWSVKENVGHLSDAERIFAYRALRIARADRTPLASFDHDGFVAVAEFDRRPLAELLDEFDAVRRATVALVSSFDATALERRGVASEKEVSVRALVHIMAGHVEHHLALLRERYGVRGAAAAAPVG